MKVLHFYRTYFPDTQGGLEEVIRQICLATKPLGVESRILTLSPNPSSDPIRSDEADVYQVKLDAELASCSVAYRALAVYSELAGWADIIHLHYPWPYADCVHLLKGRAKPAVLTYHSDIVRQKFLKLIYRPVEQLFLSRVDALVATSENYLESSSNLQYHANKTQVIPIGLDESSYPSVDEEYVKSVEKKYGRDFYFFIGVLRYYKGLDHLLDAMEGLSAKLVIAGMGPETSRLQEKGKAMGLDNVVFAGYISDQEKMACYQLCRATVLPSCERSEAFGVSLLEAAMMAKPLISCELGTGTSYINKHGETGLVVDPGNAAALREAMEKIFSDDLLTEKMGKAARKRYEEIFTAKEMGENYFQLYQKTIGHIVPEVKGILP